MRFAFALLALLAAGLASGCASAVAAGHNTALDSIDLESMTELMAQSLGGEPRVRDAVARSGRLVVVVQPVENRLTGEVLPEGQAEMFTARVRSLLSHSAPNTFTWVMNRDAFYHLRTKETDVDLGPAPERMQPQYALTARFSSLAQESAKARSASYLCAFFLTDLRDGTVLWTDSYKVKKVAVKGFLD